MSRPPLIHFAMIVSTLLMACGVDAQDRLRPSDPFSFSRMIVRGQDHEAEEAGEENPFENHLETDRDSFTPSTSTVGLGRAIFESSYSFVDNRRVAETHSFPEILFRIGVTERIELRVGGNYEIGGESASVSGGSGHETFSAGGGEIVDETQLLYGLKVRLTEHRGWVPQSSFLFQGHTPTSGPDPATAFSLGYVFGWELPDEWKLDSAIRLGLDKTGNDRFESWAPSVVLRKSFAERWNVHAEYFSIHSQNKADDFAKHFFSPGVHYLITPNVELGVRVGWGLNDEAARFFSNAGLGLRF